MNESDFEVKQIVIKEVAGGIASIPGRVPALWGVYGWFRTLEPPSSEQPKEFYDQLVKRANHTYGIERNTFIAPNLHVKVTPKTNADEHFPKLLQACEQAAFRQWLRGALGGVSSFMPPLYVGATENLSRRVKEHLQPDSDFRTRVEKAEIGVKDLIFRYVVLPQVEGDLTNLDKDVEAIIAYILIPWFSIKYGNKGLSK